MMLFRRSRTPLAKAGRPAFGSFEEKLALAVFAAALALFTAQGARADEVKIGNLSIDDPFTRATPDGAKVGAGYMVVKNKGATADRLIAATADVAGRAEIHEMAMSNGVMTMRPQPNGVAVPANGEVALKPGGYHIMFLDLKAPIALDKPVTGTLTFEKAGTVSVTYKVVPVGASSAGGGHSGGHGK
ncbi:copper chaperone PCu(A)C [Xanthobacter pseudotagetidis]|uniref:copper chaperone PCu(A)C n=1 Tax=Xanthobacter pseudotagetidis TaxID=3119911 RepID=UPI00372C41D4